MDPILGTLLAKGLSLLGNAFLAKGKAWVEEKTGVELSPQMSDADVVKLKIRQMELEEELQKIQLEEDKLGVELYKIQAADTQGAREMNTRIEESVNASWLAKNIAPILALVVVVGGGALFAYTKDASEKMAVVSVITLVLGFYFGTSSGSQTKDALIHAVFKEKAK